MIKAVWKFPLVPVPLQDISMPQGARILHVDTQHETMNIWAAVDPEAEAEIRKIAIVGTGHEAPLEGWTHLGSAMMHGGEFVYHVFEKTD